MLRLTALLNILFNTILLCVTDGRPTIHLLISGNETKTVRCLVSNKTLNSAITLIPRNLLNYTEPMRGHGNVSIVTDNELLNDTNWSWKKSNHYKLGIILDRRWESFKVDNVKKEKKLLIHIDAASFQIPFSVLSSANVTVLLYENTSYVEFALGSTISANCNNGCNNHTIIKQAGIIFNAWNHFILDINNKSILLSECNNSDCQPVMEVVASFIPTSMQANSEEFSLWKIHTYNFAYFSSNSSNTSGTFKCDKDMNCISLFVKVCEHCTLRIDVLPKTKKSNSRLGVQTISNNQDWEEITFDNSVMKMRKFQMHVEYTISKTDDFIAISSITMDKSCNYRELHATYNFNNFTCYAIKYPSWKLTTSSFVVRKELDENNRNNNYFGTTDIKCQMVTNTEECLFYGICELDGSNQTCYCANGFIGQNCENRCSDGYYGTYCKNKCGKCNKSCNNVDGTCKQCRENFYGDSCQESRLPLVKNAPIIIENGTTQVLIEINTSHYASNKSVTAYGIQYRGTHDDRWKNSTKLILPNDETFSRTLNKLKGHTNYKVRTILFSNDENYEGVDVPVADFHTTCKDIAEEDIIIDATNTTANITLNNFDALCDNQRLKLEFNNSIQNIASPLTSLTPYTNYTIGINQDYRNIINKTFTTMEGVSTAVEAIFCDNTTDDTVNLAWTPPIKPNGVISTYTISHEILKFKACSENEASLTPTHIVTNSNRTSWIIDGLHPYAVYSVKVWANNNGAPSESQRCYTESSDTLTRDEFRDITIFEKEEETLQVSVDKDCTKLNGPIHYNLTLTCFSYLCNNTVLHITEKEPTPILPYSKYKISANLSRNSKDLQLTYSKTYTTKPRAPLQIQNVSVYSKTNSSLYLRWSPPYPPRGELHQYNVELNGTKGSKTIEPCKIWTKMHCTELNGLEINKVYNLRICAENFNTTCGNYSEMQFARTVVEKSSPPINLIRKYDDEYENLTLKWSHPNATNGPLNSFKISVRDLSDDHILYNKTDKLSRENFSYTHNVTVEFFSKKVKAAIVAINEAGESDKLESDAFYTPPITPTINVTYTSDNTNTTLNLNIRPNNLHGESTLYLVVTSKNGARKARELDNWTPQLKNIIKRCKINEDKLSWIEKENNLKNNSNDIIKYTIGNDASKFSPVLNIEENYIITVFIENKFQNLTRFAYYKIEAKDKIFLADESNALWWLVLLLLFVPLIIWIVLKQKRLNLPFRNRHATTYISTDHPRTECAPPNIFKMREFHCTKPVRIDELEGYIQKALESGELNRQHEVLPRGQTKPWAYGKIEQNLKKNRYNNLAAYDHTRVVLSKIKDDKYSDYINANYIDGYKVPKAYIATQGPKPTTVKDFWRMIWQENVRYIVMVTNLIEGDKKKTEKYWPDINTNASFDDIEVEAVFAKVFADYEQRVFKVLSGGEEREITQLHFVSWPDHGIPLYAETLVPFLRELLEIPLGESPMVVHCSAGVGRTGTIILCDICLRMALNEGQVDVFHYFSKLREQRANMVDNDKQYKLVHLILLNYLLAPDTNYSCDNNFNSRVLKLIGSKGYISQINHLKKNEWQDVLMDQDYGEKPIGCPEKDRFPQIIPNTNSRVFIKPYPEGSENSSYINAVKVDGFRAPGKFIVTQQPLPNTLGDFWRLMEENEINLIISLNDTKHETCCDYWPTEDNLIMSPVPYITLQHIDTICEDIYNIVTVKFTDDNNPQKYIYILQFKHWSHKKSHPADPRDIITLYEEMMRFAKLSTTILVTCFDGANASGLFVTLAFVLDKIKLEQQCNVCLAVKATRHARREFVQNENQFVYLYRCAMEYLKEFDTYANFS